MQTETYYDEPPVRRRRRRWPVALTILLVILVGLAITADRVAASVADDRIATEVDKELSNRGFSTASTNVTVGGFPFLTQVAAGEYKEITIDMTEVRGERGRIPQLTVVATGVRADAGDLIDGTAKVTAEQVTGDGLVDWATLTELVDYNVPGLTEIGFGASGTALRLRATATIAGQRFPLAALVDFSVKNGVLHVQVRNAEAEGRTLSPLLQAALDELVHRLTADVRLPGLPFRLTVDRVTVQADGLNVAATARDVPIAG
jgi:hypothetical protein